MKTLLAILLIAAAGFGGYYIARKDQPKTFEEQFAGGDYAFFATTTITSTSVGNYNWVRVATTSPNLGFVSFCDNADLGVNSNNPIYLGFGATSTKPYGVRLGSGQCYTMSQADNNMFYGFVYAIASGSTSTILSTYK